MDGELADELIEWFNLQRISMTTSPMKCYLTKNSKKERRSGTSSIHPSIHPSFHFFNYPPIHFFIHPSAHQMHLEQGLHSARQLAAEHHPSQKADEEKHHSTCATTKQQQQQHHQQQLQKKPAQQHSGHQQSFQIFTRQ